MGAWKPQPDPGLGTELLRDLSLWAVLYRMLSPLAGPSQVFSGFSAPKSLRSIKNGPFNPLIFPFPHLYKWECTSVFIPCYRIIMKISSNPFSE